MICMTMPKVLFGGNIANNLVKVGSTIRHVLSKVNASLCASLRLIQVMLTEKQTLVDEKSEIVVKTVRGWKSARGFLVASEPGSR